MEDFSKKVSAYVDAYHSGVYTQDEAVGAIIENLIATPDFKGLWTTVPSWAQEKIQEFLKTCDNSTSLYDSSSKTTAPIDPRLLELKHWLENTQ